MKRQVLERRQCVKLISKQGISEKIRQENRRDDIDYREQWDRESEAGR